MDMTEHTRDKESLYSWEWGSWDQS